MKVKLLKKQKLLKLLSDSFNLLNYFPPVQDFIMLAT